MKSLWLFASVALVGCSGIGLSTGDGTGGGGGGTSSASGTGGSGGSSSGGAAGAQGIDCGTDPSTGATLCLGISTCPGLLVDSDAFPGCGFRVHADVLDLECSCTEQLCPIGIATSCADAQTLMQQQGMAAVVCSQISDGRCTGGGAPDASATNTCNQTCYSSCASNPTCIAGCGC